MRVQVYSTACVLVVVESFICFRRFLFRFSIFHFCFALSSAMSAISPSILFCFGFFFLAVFASPPPVFAVPEPFIYLEVWEVSS